MVRAICAGINKYASGINGLNKCVLDANNMAHLIKSKNPTAEIVTRMDYTATRSEFFAIMKSQADQMMAGDTLIYYQSSHGTYGWQKIKDFPEYYRATALEMTDGELWDWEVRKCLGEFKLGVNVIWITDSCFSEDNFKAVAVPGVTKLSRRVRAKDPDVAYVEHFQEIRCNVIAISSSDEYSVSYESSNGGVMTCSLIAAANTMPAANYFEVFKMARATVIKDGWPQRLKFSVINGADVRLTYNRFLC